MGDFVCPFWSCRRRLKQKWTRRPAVEFFQLSNREAPKKFEYHLITFFRMKIMILYHYEIICTTIAILLYTPLSSDIIPPKNWSSIWRIPPLIIAPRWKILQSVTGRRPHQLWTWESRLDRQALNVSHHDPNLNTNEHAIYYTHLHIQHTICMCISIYIYTVMHTYICVYIFKCCWYIRHSVYIMYIHSFEILLPCPAQSEVKFQSTLPPEIMFPTISSFCFICSRLGRGILHPFNRAISLHSGKLLRPLNDDGQGDHA